MKSRCVATSAHACAICSLGGGSERRLPFRRSWGSRFVCGGIASNARSTRKARLARSLALDETVEETLCLLCAHGGVLHREGHRHVGHGARRRLCFARRTVWASGTAAMAPRDHPNSSGGRAASAARGRHLDECERTTALGELRGVLLVSPQLSPQRPAPTTDGRGSRSRGSCSASRHYVFPGHLLQSKSARDDPRAGCCGPAVRHVTSSPSLAPPMAHSQVLELLH